MHRSGSSPGGSPRKCSTRMQAQETLTQQQQPPRIQNTRGLQKTSRGLLRLAHIILRRHRYTLIVAPLLYVMGAFFYMKSLPSVQSPTVQSPGPPAGSLYRSPQLFLKLWPHMLTDNSSANVLTQAWGGLKKGQRWRSCIRPTPSHLGEMPPANGYMVIEANGGLNQQRMSICDAVAVAGLLNATLVIPSFHFNSVWRDRSNFSDIFDEDYFIQTLQNDVRVVRHLPEAVLEKFNYNISNVVNLRLKASTSVNHYLKKVLPNLIENGVIRVSPFANRLPSDVPINIQRLRCLANYEALRFSKPIASLGSKLVDRMVKHSLNSDGKYISVHLRFEEDMVAFSCCIYDGGEEEKRELDIARDRAWRGKFQKHGRVIRPDANRRDGKCPLTPLEVGMVLRAMGFDNSTSIYLAAGKIYRAEKYMEPLTRMFPLLQTKETLATPEELAPFKRFSSRMAALDYTVCLYSEIFFTTQGGNFPHFLVGHRRYLNNGHSKTLKPDKRKLAVLFDNPNIRWETLKEQMKSMLKHSDMKGVEGRKANSSIYSFPTPECMCRSNRNQ